MISPARGIVIAQASPPPAAINLEMQFRRPRQTIHRLLAQVRRADAESAIFLLNFQVQSALMICRGRDDRLLKWLEAVIAGETLAATAAGELASARAIGFARIAGFDVRRIALMGRRPTRPVQWIGRAVRSGVFGRPLRGVTALIVERGGAINAVCVGQTLPVVPMLVAAREAMTELRSRSNRGQLIGPYWYRAHGPGAGALLVAGEAPSALADLFSENAIEGPAKKILVDNAARAR